MQQLYSAYVTVAIDIKNNIVIKLETESEYRKKTIISNKGVDQFRDLLFKTPNENIIFEYNSDTGYDAIIQGIKNLEKQTEVRTAFKAFQDYVTNTIRSVVADK